MNASTLLRAVVSTVAYGGNALINVGPAADGTIPTIFKERLSQLGAWLRVNGEGIYGSRPWRVQNETSAAALMPMSCESPQRQRPAAAAAAEVFYTATNSSTVYAFVVGWPAGGVEITLAAPRPLPNATVTLLLEEGGGGRMLAWKPLLAANTAAGAAAGGVVVSLLAVAPSELLGHHQVWTLKLSGVR